MTNGDNKGSNSGSPESIRAAEFIQRGTYVTPSGVEVTMREMTGHEEAILSSQAKARSGESLREVLQACIMTEDIDVDQLLIGDQFYLVVMLRRLSYGDLFSFKAQCGRCGFENKLEVSLDKMAVKHLNGDRDKQFEMTLPKSGLKVKMRLLRVIDQKRMSKMIRDGEVPRNMVSLLASILSIGDSTAFDYKQLLDLPSYDLEHLRKRINDEDCGVDTTITAECGSCGESFELELPLGEGFFLPISTAKNF